jgi:site-specific recombinase XerD
MILHPDVQVIRDEYLMPYVGGTRKLYTYYLDRYLDWCALQAYEPLTVTRADVERYVHHLHIELGMRPSSVATALCPVRGFYRFGYHEGAIDRDPAVHARRPRYYYRPSDTLGLDRSQLTAFLAAGTAMGGRYYAAAFLLGCMALRASEACSLEVGDYQQTVRGHRVLEFIGKAGLPAQMPLPVPVLRALDAAVGDRTDGSILLRLDGLPLGRSGLNTIVHTIGRRAGIELPFNSHVLRHSAITNALEAGASLRKVMDLARHSEPRTTMRYDRNRTQLDDHAVHALVSFVAPNEAADDMT